MRILLHTSITQIFLFMKGFDSFYQRITIYRVPIVRTERLRIYESEDTNQYIENVERILVYE
jgi:hypothetical protein